MHWGRLASRSDSQITFTLVSWKCGTIWCKTSLWKYLTPVSGLERSTRAGLQHWTITVKGKREIMSQSPLNNHWSFNRGSIRRSLTFWPVLTPKGENIVWHFYYVQSSLNLTSNIVILRRSQNKYITVEKKKTLVSCFEMVYIMNMKTWNIIILRPDCTSAPLYCSLSSPAPPSIFSLLSFNSAKVKKVE